MERINWSRPVQLWRRSGGKAIAPDPPLWQDAGPAGSGTLAEIVRQHQALPASHRRYHDIVTANGTVLVRGDDTGLYASAVDRKAG